MKSEKFHVAFKNFWEDNDLPQLFIDTPEWTKITEMAKEVLKTFDYEPDNNASQR